MNHLTFRLSDEKQWASEPFTASSPEELRSGIRSAWDALVASRSAVHPAFAITARLAEIDAEYSERLSHSSATEEQLMSWRANAEHRKHEARKQLAPNVRLHVRSSVNESVWLTPHNRVTGPLVARNSTLDECTDWLSGSYAIVAHDANIAGMCDDVGRAVRAVQFPPLRPVK